MTTTTTSTTNTIHLPGTPTFAEWSAIMRNLHADVLAGRRPDSALIFEPASVYSLGKHSTPHDHTSGVEFVWMDRGGRASWAGPGVLVGMPIVKLFDQAAILARGWGEGEMVKLGAAVDRLAAIAHERALERAVMATARRFGVHTERVRGRGGVWVPADDRGRPLRKLASVGTRIDRGVSMFGTELHVCPDLAAFDAIVLCGLDGVKVTSLAAELGRDVSVEEVLPVFAAELAGMLRAPAPAPMTCKRCGAWTWEHADGTCPE